MRHLSYIVLLALLAAGLAGPSSASAAEYRDCGWTYGKFAIAPGYSISGAIEDITTRNVQCPNAKRFAHRLFFSQPCVYCDGSYPYGWMRFQGFNCHVGKGYGSNHPQTYKCKRGGRRISFDTGVVF